MSEVINDGGPAHPIYDREWDHGRDEWRPTIESTGLTMRDHFAGLALQGICAHADTWGLVNTELVAMQAYRLADDMIKARSA